MTQLVKGHTGRPKVEPTDEDVATVEKMAGEGFGIEAISRAMGIDRTTFTRWRKEHPAVATALTFGKEAEEKELVSILRTAAEGGNIAAAMFLLKTRHGYREQGEPPGQGGNSVNITFQMPGAQKPETYVYDDRSAN